MKRILGRELEEEGEEIHTTSSSSHDMEGKEQKDSEIIGIGNGMGIAEEDRMGRGKEKKVKESCGEVGDLYEGIEYWLVYDVLSF